MRQDGYLAATRFGLGIKPEEAGAIDASPKQWLLSQLARPDMGSASFSSLPSSTTVGQTMLAEGEKVRQAKIAGNAPDKMLRKQLQRNMRDLFMNEMLAKFHHASTTTTPFYERLVDFWSNHFTVSIQKGRVAGFAGALEREAIRPYVTGNFREMLLAVSHHPAMLIYLDNAQSVGPNSPAGQRNNKGLNENFAREIMELHTLGVGSGYTQTDVTAFAKVLTGWSIGNEKTGNPGQFIFYVPRHEPGPQVILGKTYADNGEQQGIDVLSDLALNLATANHLAYKLARHFIADAPPAAAVTKLAQVYSQTGGSLMAVYQALIDLPMAWTLAAPKIKSNYHLVVSAARLCGSADLPPMWPIQSLQFMGGMPMNALSPAGYPDTIVNMAGPETVMRRIEWAKNTAAHVTTKTRAVDLAELAIGPIMATQTRQAIATAATEREALGLLLASPEFQRR